KRGRNERGLVVEIQFQRLPRIRENQVEVGTAQDGLVLRSIGFILHRRNWPRLIWRKCPPDAMSIAIRGASSGEAFGNIFRAVIHIAKIAERPFGMSYEADKSAMPNRPTNTPRFRIVR